MGTSCPVYIGYSTDERLFYGYHGSVSSREYRKIWEDELRVNPHLFKTKLISIHETREQALEKEYKLQKHFKVDDNPLYINKAITAEIDFTKYKNKRKLGGRKRKKKPAVESMQDDPLYRTYPVKKPEDGPINIRLVEDEDDSNCVEFNDLYLRFIVQNPSLLT